MTVTPIAVTMGEPAGISGEITIKAWQALRSQKDKCFFVIGCREWLREAGVEDKSITDIQHPSEAADIFARAIPLLPLSKPITPCGNVPHADNAPLVIESIDRAVQLCLDGQASAVVTNPIHKGILMQGGFAFSGHTGYLAHLCGMPASDVVMMLANDNLRVVPATQHVPLVEVVNHLNGALIEKTLAVMGRALVEQFAISKPRIAVAGLNPHAGEGGNIGSEEQDFINQAVAASQKKHGDTMTIEGCFPADSLFATHLRGRYDAVLCMYHDQALIPIKALDFDNSVNISLGLPIVRTSPDHGTACDLHGSGKASPNSLLAALHMAWEMASRHG